MTYSDRSRQRLWIISPEMNYLAVVDFNFFFGKNWQNIGLDPKTTSVILSTGGCISQHALGQTPLLDRHPPCPVHAGIHIPLPSACWDTPRTVYILLECILVFYDCVSAVVFEAYFPFRLHFFGPREVTGSLHHPLQMSYS